MNTQLEFNCGASGFLHASHANDAPQFLTCSTCGRVKATAFFFKREGSRTGRRSNCKDCSMAEAKSRLRARAESSRAYHKAYRIKNREKFRGYAKNYYRKHIVKNRKRLNSWRLNNKAWFAEYQKKRLKNDPAFKLRKNIARRIGLVLSGGSNSESVLDLIGCSSEFLRFYLESKFKAGMTWDNYGLSGWHVDHIRPCSSFDLTRPDEQRLCFHFLNLQPLWASENLRKGDSFTKD